MDVGCGMSRRTRGWKLTFRNCSTPEDAIQHAEATDPGVCPVVLCCVASQQATRGWVGLEKNNVYNG